MFSDLDDDSEEEESEEDFVDSDESGDSDEKNDKIRTPGNGFSKGIRIPKRNKQEDLTVRMSVGNLAPGIKVRGLENIMNENAINQRLEHLNQNDPACFSLQGGLLKMIKERLTNFLTNPPEFNLFLVSIIVQLCSFPVKLDVLDGQFNSTTCPTDETQSHLTLIHMIMLNQPLTTA